MPFNAAGVYTPANGATSAAPGTLIQSAVWNAIFNDISSALTLLGIQLFGTTNVAATPYVPLATDSIILVNVAGAAVVNLPTSASRNGYPLIVKDLSGLANTNNITINKANTDTIEGLTSVTISDDYGYFVLHPISGGWILLT